MIAENKRSWIVGPKTWIGSTDTSRLKGCIRIPKSGPIPSNIALDAHHIDELAFVQDNLCRVISWLSHERLSADTLHQIIKIVGYPTIELVADSPSNA